MAAWRWRRRFPGLFSGNDRSSCDGERGRNRFHRGHHHLVTSITIARTMPPGDNLSERFAPFVEWAVFRFRRIVATTIVTLLCLVLVAWTWATFSARDRSSLAGRVTVAGRPVTFGTITVVTANGTTLTTSIRPDGSYLLPHVPSGAVQIAVSSPDPESVFQKATAPYAPVSPPNPATSELGDRARKAAQKEQPAEKSGDVTIAARVKEAPPSTQPPSRPEHAGWFRIPGRYADPSRSGLSVTVEPHGATFDLELSPGK